MKNWLIVVLVVISAQVSAVEDPDQYAGKGAATKEAADKITAYAAGYCKGLADKHGVDFVSCFKQATDYAIAKLDEIRVERKQD